MSLKKIDMKIVQNLAIENLNGLPEIHKKNSERQYVYIGNIPQAMHSSDLRNFFKDFTEKNAFECFHFRHRPETNAISGTNLKLEIKRTCCCIVKVKTKFKSSFIDKYNKKEWYNRRGEFLNSFANVKLLNVIQNKSDPIKYKSKSEVRSNTHEEEENINFEELKSLIELNPPNDVMPHGNVGTPTKYFLKLISECKMPSSVLKKLDIEFPSTFKRNTFYSSVPMDYCTIQSGNNLNKGKSGYAFDRHRNTSHRQTQITKEADNSGDTSKTLGNCDVKREVNLNDSTEDYVNGKTDIRVSGKTDISSEGNCGAEESEKEDCDAEDWERYESLHDNVDNQDRPKERMFEEDIELKWEKGGSGLVFYTDAYFWNELKGKDFDEDTVDDWDVDYSVYYEDGAGDKSARDQLRMRIEQRRRAGKFVGPVKYSQIRRKEKIQRKKMDHFAEFEKSSNAFGSKILKKRGWTEGEGIGLLKQGICEPLNLNGQASTERTGLGYYGDKLDRSASLKRKAEKDVFISTIYDDKDREQFDAMRYYGKDLLKYRTPEVEFTRDNV